MLPLGPAVTYLAVHSLQARGEDVTRAMMQAMVLPNNHLLEQDTLEGYTPEKPRKHIVFPRKTISDMFELFRLRYDPSGPSTIRYCSTALY